ncbi:N-ATPase, AtpR subunit [Maioricimonas rarisocia]|uniref:N-ATPase, AtpR subunit n=1 Tax=Maioricimonas rarisocia TaxID=2528026 RepID=A0A517Z982_9PLAN|nr:ATP synthase subunit I [Maioricimonas rarisocia]QDU39035.1 N-ATPase, AtpR subunit [Maioricimonas rarisocia]
MNDVSATQFAMAIAGGFGLGMVFFGGLWWTLRRLPDARHPALLVAVSFVVRMVIAVGGLYFVMGTHWQRAIAGLLGFLAARWFILRRVRRDLAHRSPDASDAGSAQSVPNGSVSAT